MARRLLRPAVAGLLLLAAPASAGAQFEESPLEVFLRAMVEIQTRYVDEGKIDTGKLLADAEDGVMAALDSESLVLPADGPPGPADIGVVAGIKESGVHVLDVLEESPAEQSGLRAGDRLLRIDGESVHEMKGPELARRLRGAAGSDVRLLWMDRQGFYSELTLRRAPLAWPSWRHFELDGVDVVQVFDFDAAAGDGVKRELRKAAERGGRGAVVDMRRATRGDLDVALNVAGACFPGGELLAVGRGADAEKVKQYVALQKDDPITTPLVILVGPSTRGAAELFACALKEHRRAAVVGGSTFGFVARQAVFPLGGSEERKVQLTVEQFSSPSQVSLTGTGVGAEIVVKEPPDREVSRLLDRRRVVQRMTDLIVDHPPAAFDAGAIGRGELKLAAAVAEGKSVAEQRGEFEQSFEIALEALLREMELEILPEELAVERLALISRVRVELARRKMAPADAMLVALREDRAVSMGMDVLGAMRKLRPEAAAGGGEK